MGGWVWSCGMNQPDQKIDIVGGIYFRSVRLDKGTLIPQHTHDHDHATYVGSGRAALYIDGVFVGECKGGDAVEIKGGKLPEFHVLEDNTLLACVWPESIGETLEVPENR